MLTRYAIALLLWIAWVLPFIRKATAARQRAVVKDSSARWGIILQGVAFAIAFSIPSLDAANWRIPAALVFGALGILTARLAVRHLDKQWRFDAALNADHALIRTGPYAVVRHPIYAGMFAMLLAWALLLAPWPAMVAAVVVFVIGTEIRVRVEDRLLQSRFREEFEAYSRQVPAYVPFVR